MDDQDNKNNNDAIDFFSKMLEINGVAISTVKDGHVMMFKREWLQALLDGNPDKPQFIVFLKKPEFGN